jgi:hypothetical protein
MTIEELERLKEQMDREARKWVAYLESTPPELREKELSRKLLETWLEGRYEALLNRAAVLKAAR